MREVGKYIALRLSKVAIVTALIAGITVPAIGVGAVSDEVCTFGGDFTRQIVVSGNTVTATFRVPHGVNNSCDRPLPYSLVVYIAPDSTLRPLSAQKLFSSNTQNFTPGLQTISTQMPACGFFQVDLVKGMPIAQLNDSGNSYAPHGRLITAIGGGNACPAPQPQPPAQPQAPAQPATVNNNTNVNTQSQTVTVNAPQAPAAQPQPVSQPVETVATTQSQGKGGSLPNTGPGSVAALFATVSIAGGLAYNLFLRRRLA